MTKEQFPLSFITQGLPKFTVGETSQVDIEVSGGTPPYHFEITQGALPQGLQLSEDGRISGAANPNTTVFVKVTDSEGTSRTQAFDVQVS